MRPLFAPVIGGNCPCYNTAYVRLIVCYAANRLLHVAVSESGVGLKLGSRLSLELQKRSVVVGFPDSEKAYM